MFMQSPRNKKPWAPIPGKDILHSTLDAKQMPPAIEQYLAEELPFKLIFFIQPLHFLLN